MDETQKTLIRAGRRDLAQKYFERTSGDPWMSGGKAIAKPSAKVSIIATKERYGHWGADNINGYGRIEIAIGSKKIVLPFSLNGTQGKLKGSDVRMGGGKPDIGDIVGDLVAEFYNKRKKIPDDAKPESGITLMT